MRAVNEGNEGKIVIPCNPVGKIQLLRSSLENAQKYCTAESLKMSEQINPKQFSGHELRRSLVADH